MAELRPAMRMKIGDASYDVEKSDVAYTEAPVTKPTTRGGVYFSDKMIFKIRVHLTGQSINEQLSKAMLGPNSDFATIVILTKVDGTDLKILANLTNYVQKAADLELNLTVVGTELCT